MHVFINNGNERCWLTDVHLKDGFCPHIGGQGNRHLTNVAPMEPAIWCKVLILESISIDCSQRVLSWSTGSSCDDAENSKNQYCINEECSGYDTEDELFDLARGIIDKSKQDVPEDDSKMSILRMLHCFVLPKVSFHRGDIAKVELAKHEQVQSIKTLDAKLKAKCCEVIESQEELYVKRNQFLPNIEEIIENNHCDKQFLEMLLQDLEQEEKRIRHQINLANDDVHSAKSQNSDGLLNEAKEKRNILMNRLELVVFAREETKECKGSLKEGVPKKPIGILQEYVAQRNTVEELKEQRHKLTEQKNCALSVREMLDGIWNDLVKKGVSRGDDADSEGHRATDVLQNVWYPEWQKLSERVATIVFNPEHPVGISFEKFCCEVHNKCQEIIGLSHLNETPMNVHGSMSAISVGPNEVPPEDRLGPSSFELNDYVVDSYRDRLLQLKRLICQHFDKMAGLLSDLFNNQETLFRNKLRLAYEHCFYEREHEFIECVYERAHHEHVNSLEIDIKRLKKLPIKLLNLPMKAEWWHEIFEQRVQIRDLNGQVFKPLAENMSSVQNGSINGVMNGNLPRCEMNGDLNSDKNSEESINDDDLEGLEVDFPFSFNNNKKPHLLDSMSVRSYFISTVRDRSRTFNYHSYCSDESDSEDAPVNRQSQSCGPPYSSSAPTNRKIILGDLIDQYQNNDGRNSFKRKSSKSYHEISKCKSPEPSFTLAKGDTFEDHFGPALQCMKDMFKAVSPVAKLKCLTASLRKIAAKVSELRMRDGQDTFTSAVTAEDLLPLLILMMLQMEPCDAASMWPQLAMLEDLMAPCLSSGCHGWALVEFQMAQRILADLCSQF